MSIFQNKLWNTWYILKKIWHIQSLPKDPYKNKQTMGNKIGVLIAQGLDVSNFLKNVPRVPKFVSEKGTTFNHFPKILKGINKPWVIR